MWEGAAAALGAALLAAGCAQPGRVAEPEGLGPTAAREGVERVLPASVADRAGWGVDVHAALSTNGLPSTPERLCAVLAVTEQESGYRADPPVPGLPAIAWKEIDRRAEVAGVPRTLVHAALKIDSPNGRSYAERIDAVRTERELSAIFEDFVGAVPLGQRLLSRYNPVRTGGPMQVSIAFAEAWTRDHRYPYETTASVRREVFTRRGGLYFGAAHLLAYDAPYDRMLYRFADFNAGRWASRNAAFQRALSVASGVPLALDGDLLPPGGSSLPGQTERAALAVADRLGLSEATVRRELALGEGPSFDDSTLYRRVFERAERLDRRTLPRAVVPDIDLHSPKFSRKLTTAWFARRVDERWRRCLGRIAPAADG